MAAEENVVAELNRLCELYSGLDPAGRSAMLQVLLLGWNPSVTMIDNLNEQQQLQIVRLLAAAWAPSPADLDMYLRDPGGNGGRLGVDLRLGAAELCDGEATNLIHPVVRQMFPQDGYQLVFERHDNDMRQQDIDSLRQENRSQKRKLSVMLGFAEGATAIEKDNIEEELNTLVDEGSGYRSD